MLNFLYIDSINTVHCSLFLIKVLFHVVTWDMLPFKQTDLLAGHDGKYSDPLK
jgi:hypothetical protein